jgi:hypothetical protein
MPKIGERMFIEGDKIVLHERHDLNPYLETARQYRDAGVGQSGEHRLVGHLPMSLVADWVREAGLKWDDTEAVQEVIKKKILSGDFDKFRVWEGRW